MMGLKGKNLIGEVYSDTFYVTLTRPLDADEGDTSFNGTTEIIEYKNHEGRRNYSNNNLTGNITEGVIKAGNYAVTNIQEADTAVSEDMAILPPTGLDIKTLCLLIFSTMVCITGVKFILNRKMYITFRKKKIRRKFNDY